MQYIMSYGWLVKLGEQYSISKASNEMMLHDSNRDSSGKSFQYSKFTFQYPDNFPEVQFK